MRATMRADLKTALKARDKVTVATLRTALAAIDNAEAVAAVEPDAVGSQHIGGAVVGVGAAEVARRELSPEDIRDIVAAEVAEREATVAQYRRIGQDERAEALLAEVAVLNRYLG